MHGKQYEGKPILAIDPHGAPYVYPEEISLETYNENKQGIWTAFHYTSEYANGAATGAQKHEVVHIEHQQLDTEIDKGGHLDGEAVISIVSRAAGLKVVPFELFRTLRVSSVTGSSGEVLNFIQEDKAEDPQFGWYSLRPLRRMNSTLLIRKVCRQRRHLVRKTLETTIPIARCSLVSQLPVLPT